MVDILSSEFSQSNCSKTVSSLFSEWYGSIRHRVKESTSANYLMKANKHILPEFGERIITSINQNDIYSFIESRQKQGLSNRYISDILVLLKSVFKYAVKTYHIFNVLDGILLPKKKTVEIQLLEKNQQKKI